jgi:uncharacterized protein with gpF-like domain
MTEREKQDYWKQYIKLQQRYEKLYYPKVNKALQNQVQSVIDKGLTQTAITEISYVELYEILQKLYLQVGVVYAARVNRMTRKERMPMGFSAEIQALILRYFQTELLNTVNDITATTREQIQAILIEAQLLGLTNEDIVKALTALDFTRIRARLIARTESTTASNQAATFAAQQNGAKTKIWISAKDNRTRRRPRDKYDHLHMDGVEVPINEPFNVSGELMMQPGDKKASAGNVCNCRCCVAFK